MAREVKSAADMEIFFHTDKFPQVAIASKGDAMKSTKQLTFEIRSVISLKSPEKRRREVVTDQWSSRFIKKVMRKRRLYINVLVELQFPQ